MNLKGNKGSTEEKGAPGRDLREKGAQRKRHKRRKGETLE